MEPLDAEVDNVRGGFVGRVIVEHGDSECPSSGRVFRDIGRFEARLGGESGFAFRHVSLTEIHPHALAAYPAAEAAAPQDRFWGMHALPSDRQKAL
jgi:hypothetical protein